MKVLIVGAGPSGLACATQILTNSESDVTVVDKKRVVGENPRCAGLINAQLAVESGLSVPQSCIVARVRRVRLYAPNEDYFEFKGNIDCAYILDRKLFEQHMADRVERLGGRIICGRLVSPKDLELWKKQYNYIIGADGSESVVRRWLNLPKFPLSDTGLAVQKTIIMPSFPQDTVEIYFGEKIAPRGYAWIFPGGGTHARIGLGIPLSEHVNTGKLLKKFIESQVYESEENHFIGKIVYVSRLPKTGIHKKVLLIGDAVPSIDPLTGGGIIQGFNFGKMAGKALAENKLKNYEDYINKQRRQYTIRYKLKNILYDFNDTNFNDMIHIMQGFRPKTMSVGKEMRRAIIRLLLRRPRLLSKFFKALH